MSTTVNGKEYKLAIRIAGTIDKSFTTSLAVTNSSLKNFQKLNNTFTTMDRGFDKIMTVGAKAFKVVGIAALAATAATAAAGIAVINAGKEFESAFAGVKKTVDATVEEYEVLRQTIRDMSLEIPSSAVEIAGVMEAAGQLGIATENLADFSKTMVNLGVSTNMTADEASVALAKFANITNMDPGNYERLGSVIVDLGNNFATTEADIVQMSTNLAATGELAGLSEPEIMAWSTAMSSVGIAAERGGSSLSKLLKKMQVATELQDDTLYDFSSVAGLSPEAFTDLFKGNSSSALAAFLNGLNDTERNGKSAIVTLQDMGLNEIRLSNTILALANASDLVTDSLNTANKAWEENTALSIEAGKRYETVDSKLQILKNSAYNLAYTAYDEIEEPLREGISWLTEGIQDLTDTVGAPNGIGMWIENIRKQLPTVVNNTKKFGSTVLNFLSPLLAAGKWLIKNPDFLAKAFIALGTALVTYKIASSLTHVVNGIITLVSSPVMLGITAALALIAGIAVAIYSVNQRAKELEKLNLQKHFGDMTLSLEELDKVADRLINKDGSLNKLAEVMSSFDKIDELNDSVQDAIRTINKEHWMVEIGMELTEENAADYQEAITQFVKGCNDYVVQQHYSVNLALTLFDDDNSLTSKVDGFFNANESELARLGKEMQEAVNNAFEDGLLDIDEIKEITELQEQMARVQAMIAGGQFEAKLDLLTNKGMGALSSESFINLQKEVQEIVGQATSDYDEAYITAMANEKAMLDSGYVTAAEYGSRTSEIDSGYRDKIADLQQRAAGFQIETIMKQYGSEVSEAAPKLQGILDEYFTEAGRDIDWEMRPGIMMNALFDDLKRNKLLGKDSKGALSTLYQNLKPTVQELEQTAQLYMDAGNTVPQEIQKSLQDAAMLGVLAGDVDAISSYLGAEFTNNPEYKKFLEIAYAAGFQMPEEIAAGMYDGIKSTVPAETAALSGNLPGYADGGIPSIQHIASRNGNLPWANLPGHADGGIFSTPHIARFAENGMESAIPIDGSSNAIRLWAQTGLLLGMGSVLDGLEVGGGGAVIEYSPTLVFNGNAPSQDDIQSALAISEDEFEAMMNKYMKNHSRLAFR